MAELRIRCIPCDWLRIEDPKAYPIEKEYYEFKTGELHSLNMKGYHIFFFPNYNSKPTKESLCDKLIDVYTWVFIDIDTSGNQKSVANKEEAIAQIKKFPMKPSILIDSGN